MPAPKVVQRRPTEVLTGTAALAASIALLGIDQKTAAVIAGALGLVPAAITWYMVRVLPARRRRAAAPAPQSYAPALDTMYVALAEGLAAAIGAAPREPRSHLALLREAAGVVSALDPRVAGSAIAAVPAEPIESEPEPEAEEPQEPEAEGGAPAEPAAPSRANGHRRRRAAPAELHRAGHCAGSLARCPPPTRSQD